MLEKFSNAFWHATYGYGLGKVNFGKENTTAGITETVMSKVWAPGLTSWNLFFSLYN